MNGDEVAGEPVRHLYFHLPFCPKLCPYCSFYVETGGENKTHRFLDALLLEVGNAAPHVQPRTIYFGGGTPSALTTDQLGYLLDGLRQRLDLSQLKEWTLEANPATVRPEKARLLRELGVTRISLGVQSWDDTLLRTLGRVHDAAQAQRTYELLRAAGFENINIDLMFGVPGQTLEQWRAMLARTIALSPEHVSTYCLTYEEDTAYFHKLQRGEYVQNVENDIAFFETTMDSLTTAGFAQYEISNYAQSGRESAHNQAYWYGADYLGFGPSAFSTRHARRWQNIPDTAEYTRRILACESVTTFHEELSPGVRRGEVIAFAFRTGRGVRATELAPFARELEEFRDLGFIEDSGDHVVLTRRGKLMADSVAAAFVEV